MKNKIDKSREAAIEFFNTANPKDEFFLVSFNDRAELTSPFTDSVEDLKQRLAYASAGGSTALLDAVYLGLSEMRGAHNAKRALLIISDGGDNHSRYSEADVRRLVQEADTQIYAIGIYSPIGVFNVESIGDLPDIATKISMELRNQYVLGYRPSNHAHDSRWRKIKVKVHPPRGLPPLSVFAKTGYYAASR
jgi:Ca-activated chloride channel family protein